MPDEQPKYLSKEQSDHSDKSQRGATNTDEQIFVDNKKVAEPVNIERRQFFKRAGGAAAALAFGAAGLKSVEAQENGFLKNRELPTEPAPGLQITVG